MLLQFKFIVAMFVMGLAALVTGSIELYVKSLHHFDGRQATMQLANPGKKLVVPSGGYDVHLIDVKYVSADGEVVVPRKQLTGDRARALAAGQGIPVTYLRSDPQRVYYRGEDPPLAWGWLGGGVVMLALGLVSVRMRRREAAGEVPAGPSRAGTIGLLLLCTLVLGALTTYLFLSEADYRKRGAVAQVKPFSEYTETVSTKQRALRADEVRVTRQAKMSYVDKQGVSHTFSRRLNDENLEKVRRGQRLHIEYIPGEWNTERFQGDSSHAWWFALITLACAAGAAWMITRAMRR